MKVQNTTQTIIINLIVEKPGYGNGKNMQAV